MSVGAVLTLTTMIMNSSTSSTSSVIYRHQSDESCKAHVMQATNRGQVTRNPIDGGYSISYQPEGSSATITIEAYCSAV